MEPVDTRVVRIIWADGSVGAWCDQQERLRPGFRARERRVQFYEDEACNCRLCSYYRKYPKRAR